MALGTDHINPGNPGVEDFLPQQWSDQIIGIYDASTSMRELVYVHPHSSNAGATINIPMEGPGKPPAIKQFETQVTLQTHDSNKLVLNVNTHWERESTPTIH